MMMMNTQKRRKEQLMARREKEMGRRKRDRGEWAKDVEPEMVKASRGRKEGRHIS
jgi:hypothetical protein